MNFSPLLLSHFYLHPVSEKNVLWLIALAVFFVIIVDFLVQVYGVKRFGGTKKAINGSIIGLIIGLIFFPVIGVILGPFIGAFIGAKREDVDANKALRIACGALAGFIIGTVLKICISLYIAYLIYLSIVNLW